LTALLAAREEAVVKRRRSPWSSWHGGSILAWTLLWLALGQGAIILFLEWRHPEFLDPKYGCRVAALRACIATQQKRPLILILGSSRAEQGFRPSLLESNADGVSPFFYNLARGGSSPLLYLLTLRRLLADGIHPDHLLIEIFPPALTEEEAGVTIYKPTLRDLPLLSRYSVHPRSWVFWLQDRLLLWYKYRNGFLAWAAPETLPPNARWGDRLWNYQGGEWRQIGEGASPDERCRLHDDAHHRYFQSLQQFRIGADAESALKELLTLCRSQRIGVTLFLMPEASEFRNWYPSKTHRRLNAYLDMLRSDWHLTVIDTRPWIADEEFADGHHLLSGGAATFTRRFARLIRSEF
jgi:hypothetical protein